MVMRFILIVTLFALFAVSGAGQSKSGAKRAVIREKPSNQITNKAVFVAYNWLYFLDTPTSPSQFFVADVSLQDKEKSNLVKLMYFPNSSSVFGGVDYLKVKPDYYLQGANISMRPPNSQESEQCQHFVNFLDAGKNNDDPQMMFHSFRYDSFMTFEFDKMKCFVLESISTLKNKKKSVS